MGLLIFYAFVSIFFSFLCSILEAVLLSITPTFINLKKKEGKSYAETLETLKKDVEKSPILNFTGAHNGPFWELNLPKTLWSGSFRPL